MKLFYRKLGTGKPIIILHGLFGLSDNWFTIGKSLSEKFEVILVDLRNHGQSPHSSQFTYQAMCEDLLDLYEELDIKEANILGHSLGGKVAMLFALEYPEKVSKLVVVDISPQPTLLRHADIISAMLAIDFDQLKTRSDVEKFLKTKLNSEKVTQLLMKNLYWADKTRLAWKLNLKGISENIDEVFKEISGDRPYPKPCLFIKGAKSDYIKEEDLASIKKLFPACVLSTIDHAGHWVHADNPVTFYSVLNDFLNRT